MTDRTKTYLVVAAILALFIAAAIFALTQVAAPGDTEVPSNPSSTSYTDCWPDFKPTA
jgi:hypothetical protein